MSEFLLVHGSCHGAWCWEEVIPELQARGHTARALDLPSHGADPTPPEAVTLDLYAEAILAAIDGPVTLVGHSMGGFPITAAALIAPEKIDRLIYLCAYVPIPGKGLAEMRRMAPRQPLIDAIEVSEDRVTFTVKPERAREVFFHDVADETAARAVARLGPQPILPQETPLPALPDVPRRYIRCADDRTIPPEFQCTMTADWPPEHVLTLTASHSPFLSMPARLADTLIALAK